MADRSVVSCVPMRALPAWMQAVDPVIRYEDGQTVVYICDILEALRRLPDNSVHLVPTDPPYGLSDQRPDDLLACLAAWGAGNPYVPRAGSGFQGREWDAWVPGPEVWREIFRVLKPGGLLLVFAGTRSMDIMSIAIRAAGFELRDSIGVLGDDGGPHLAGWTYSTGLPKSRDVAKAIDDRLGVTRRVVGTEVIAHDIRGGPYVGDRRGAYVRDRTVPTSAEAQEWAGWGTALKPGWEPILIFRKPLEGTVADNVLKHGCGGINIDATRTDGRWPSNVFHCTKASTAERDGCEHPCVKPLALMRHLIRLGCPPGGTVLDPFVGSGTTLEAARLEGCRGIGVDADPQWLDAIVRRIARADGRQPPASPTPIRGPTPATDVPEVEAAPVPAIPERKATLEIPSSSAEDLKDLRRTRRQTTAQVVAAGLAILAEATAPPG